MDNVERELDEKLVDLGKKESLDNLQRLSPWSMVRAECGNVTVDGQAYVVEHWKCSTNHGSVKVLRCI